MNSARPSNSPKLLSLKDAAQTLGVSVSDLLTWNEYNILKPTITQEGEVRYTQEQLDQFLAIRQLIPFTPASQTTITSPFPEKPLQFNENKTVSSPSARRVGIEHVTARIPWIISSCAIVCVVAVLAFVQQGEIRQVLNQYVKTSQQEARNIGKILSAQSSYSLAEEGIFAPPIQLKTEEASNKNLNNEGETVLLEQIHASSPIYEPKLGKPETSSQQSQMTILASVFGQTNTPLIKPSDSNSDGTTYSDSSTFVSPTPCLSCSNTDSTSNNSSIDTNGNIRGDSTGDLATTFGGTSMNGSSSSSQAANIPNDLLLLVVLGLISSLFLFTNPFAFASKKPQQAISDRNDAMSSSMSQKILEVDQKTDGTVVLHFQGKEYKVSKPELDSESDQFIDRLMGLMQPGMKEIDYDCFTDNKVRYTTPLSRLVTRLGFVGVKRELFFPRTSKNRVLFRKYITLEDLQAMNLTTAQISTDFGII